MEASCLILFTCIIEKHFYSKVNQKSPTVTFWSTYHVHTFVLWHLMQEREKFAN